MQYVIKQANGPDEYTGIYPKSKGGTEQQYFGLLDRLSKDPTVDLNKYQFICSRVRKLDPKKKAILWLHDVYNDPENKHFMDPKSLDRFAKLVFVSNHQFTAYHTAFNIPYSKSVIIPNSIEPFIGTIQKDLTKKVKMIYHTTPHRGLEILVPVFKRLYDAYPHIELDVYSSFGIYGWSERDAPYQKVFDECREHPAINYHGFVPNSQIRDALKEAHIFAYPSIWPETSCISAIEAMAAGVIVVCPDYGALQETVGNHGLMYRYHEDPNIHAMIFMKKLEEAIVKNQDLNFEREHTSLTVNIDYEWSNTLVQWKNLLKEIDETT